MGKYNYYLVKGKQMIKFSYNNIKIAGIAVAVPDKKIEVDKFISQFGEDSVQKFKKMTGVVNLHFAEEKQTASDLGFVAARDLILQKKIDPSTIGALIFVSQSPDYKVPATAGVLHKRLGLPKNCLSYDINLGCSGYVYGLQAICSAMQSSNIKRALLIVGDTISKMVSPEDRSAAMLFGDAGSATLLEKAENSSPIKAAFRTQGEGYRAIVMQGGGFRNPTASPERCMWGDGNIRSDYDLYMNGTEVFNFTISEVPKLLNEFMVDDNKGPDDYDCLVLHQANLFILKQIAKKTKFSMDKVPVSIDDFGNTSVASIPLTFAKTYSNDITSNQLEVLMCGFGVGLSWGVLSAGINVNDIFPIIYTNEYFVEGGIIRD